MKKSSRSKRPSRKAIKKTPKTNSHPVNKLGLVPLGDRILIKPIIPETKTPSGIIIPETVDKTKPNQGIVLAVGTGKRNEKGERVPFDVKVGDRVFFTKPWTDPEKINGVEYYFVQESEILAILK